MATPPVCNWNKYGYCRHRDNCRKQHINESCESSSCDVKSCLLRHPMECKFFNRYRRCKFNPCKFLHIDNPDINQLSEKLKTIEEDIANKDEEIKRLGKVTEELVKNSIVNIVKEVEDKINIFQSNLETMKICMAEKDAYISALEERVKAVEDKFEIVMNEHADKVKETFECSECEFVSNCLKGLNVHKSKKHKSEADVVNLNCLKCNFKGDNEDLLKVHNIRKHTDKTTLKYPNNCHVCEYELKNCKEVRIQMDIHAFEFLFG